MNIMCYSHVFHDTYLIPVSSVFSLVQSSYHENMSTLGNNRREKKYFMWFLLSLGFISLVEPTLCGHQKSSYTCIYYVLILNLCYEQVLNDVKIAKSISATQHLNILVKILSPVLSSLRIARKILTGWFCIIACKRSRVSLTLKV